MKNGKLELLDWLCFKRVPDYLRAPWLGALAGFVIIFIALILVVSGLVGVVYLLGAFVGFGPYENDTTGVAIRNLGLVLAALFGAPFLVWRSIIAQKQVNVAEQGQITDRINKAVEGLGSEKTVREIIEIPRYQKDDNGWIKDDEGNLVPALRPDGIEIIDRESYERTSPNLEVRIGAIYALERIAQDSMRDHIQIMEILCAYVRENAPATSIEPAEGPSIRATPRADIQAAITVFGRRLGTQIELETQQQFRLDLRNTDLSGVDFRNGDFSAAIFYHSRFEAALFRDSRLLGTQFQGALLNFADFFNAELRGTVFDLAIINKPVSIPGGMTQSINMGEIYGISLAGADITAINYLGGPKKTNLTFGTKDTKLSPQLEFDRNKFESQLLELRELKQDGDIEKATKLETELLKNNFVRWCPYDYNDGALGWLYHEFLDELGLHGWPYR